MPDGVPHHLWVKCEHHTAFDGLDNVRIVDDDFTDRALNATDVWRASNGTGCTQAVIGDLEDGNGILRVRTTTTASVAAVLDKNNIRQVRSTKQPIYVARVKRVTAGAENFEWRIGLVDVLNTDHCIFLIDRSAIGSLSVYAHVTNTSVVRLNADTGVDLDNNWHLFCIYVDATGKPYFYIDEVLVAQGAAGDVDPAEWFQPYQQLYTEDAVTRDFYYDFVKCWQKR